MTLPAWLHFFRRTFPSANMALVRGKRPVLVDTRFGSDLPETERLLREAGMPPERLNMIVNTHYHCDHVGGNSGLQRKYGIPIATYYSEAAMVNDRDISACGAEWLVHPIEPYHVDRPLRDGDEIDTGNVVLQVLHTPGHTLGHISLYARDQVLILGDAVHADDVSWINIFQEGTGALYRTIETLEELLRLPVQIAMSGHGPVHDDPHGAMRIALRRYERWLKDPARVAWHACKRIFSYALILRDGMSKAAAHNYLLGCPWFQDYSRVYMRQTPTEFVESLLDEMVRSGAAAWQAGRLVATVAYTTLAQDWYPSPLPPRHWPPT